MFALKQKNFELAKIFIEEYNKEINIKHIDNNGFNIFDYAFCEGSSLTYECIDFIKSIFNAYGKNIDQKFLNTCTRYGRNSLLNLCEDYALHIYERLYFLEEKNSIDFIRKKSDINDDDSDRDKYYIPKKYHNEIFNISVKELKDFISKSFYPLIEEFIKRGCDINC